MNFLPTEAQAQFKATLRRFVADRSAPGVQESPAARIDLWRHEYWMQLAELGVAGMLLPESLGGTGGNAIDAMIVMEELGRGVAAAPYIERAVIGAGLIAGLGSEPQKRRWLPRVAVARLDVVIAEGGFCGGSGAIGAAGDGTAFIVDGRQDVVTAGRSFDLLLLVAPRRETDECSLFVLEPARPDVAIQFYTTIDDRPAASIAIDHARLDGGHLIGPFGGAGSVLAAVYDEATVAQCAEAMGLMAHLLNKTIGHLKTRVQFGQKLMQFQALQHRLADMYLDYELAVSATYKAAIVACEDDARHRARAVSAAKHLTVRAARRVGSEAIQMHGAMGMTDELSVGRAVKRLQAMETQYGSPAFHLRRYQESAR